MSAEPIGAARFCSAGETDAPGRFDSCMRDYDIRAAKRTNRPVSSLCPAATSRKSWSPAPCMLVQPDWIVAVNPTRGLDIGATRFVHSADTKQRGNGRCGDCPDLHRPGRTGRACRPPGHSFRRPDWRNIRRVCKTLPSSACCSPAWRTGRKERASAPCKPEPEVHQTKAMRLTDRPQPDAPSKSDAASETKSVSLSGGPLVADSAGYAALRLSLLT